MTTCKDCGKPINPHDTAFGRLNVRCPRCRDSRRTYRQWREHVTGRKVWSIGHAIKNALPPYTGLFVVLCTLAMW